MCLFKHIDFDVLQGPNPMFSAVVCRGACKVCFKDTYVSSRGCVRCIPYLFCFPSLNRASLGRVNEF